MAVGLGTAVGYLNLDISGFAKGVDSAISDMNKLSSGFSGAAQSLQAIGGTVTKVGSIFTSALTAPIVGFGAASVKAGMDFDKQMSAVKAVTGATGEEFEALRNEAREWGKTTKFSATESAEALYYMGLAGWGTNESIAGLGSVLNLAAAGNLELGRASDIVTDALTAFGYEASDASGFVDVLAAAMSNSNTDVDQMGEAFKYVGSVAGAFKYSVEDVALALGLFANVGVKSTQAGTGLRQALNALVNPSDKAAALMDQYGVSLFNADGSTKDLMTVMLELRDTFGDVNVNGEKLGEFIDGLGVDLDTLEGETAATDAIMQEFGHDLPTTDFEKLSAIVKIFGVRALPGMLSVINSSEEDFNSLRDAIYNSGEAFVSYEGEIYTMQEAIDKFGEEVVRTSDAFEILGSAEAQAAIMQDNLAGDWTKFTSALGETKIIISDMANTVLRDFVQKLTDLVNWFNELSPAQQEQIVKWAMIVAAIGPVLMIIGKVISAVGTIISVFGTLKSAFSVLGAGIGNFGTILGTLKTGFSGVISAIGSFGTTLGGLGLPILGVVAVIGVLIAAVVNLWNNNEEFRNKVIEIWNGIKAVFEAAGQAIVDIINSLGFDFENFGELMSAVIGGLGELWNGFCELLAPVFTGALEIIGIVLEGLVDTFTAILEIIVGIVKGFKDGDWSMLWQGIGDIVMAAVKTMGGILDTLAEIVWNIIQTVAGWFGSDWSMTWDEAKEAVGKWFKSIVEWFKDVPRKVSEHVGSALEKVKGWGNDMVASAKETGEKFSDKVTGGMKVAANGVADFIEGASRGIFGWSSDMDKASRDVKDNFPSNVISGIKGLPETVGGWLDKGLKAVSDWADGMSKEGGKGARELLDGLGSAIKNLPNTIKNIGIEIVNGVWKGFVESQPAFVKNIEGFFGNIVKSVKNKLEIRSPSGVFRKEVGRWMPPGISEGFADAMPEAIRDIQDDLDEGIDSIEVKDIDSGNITLEDQLTDFTDAYKQVFEGLVIWFETMEERMGTAIEGLTDYFKYLMNVKDALDAGDRIRISLPGENNSNGSVSNLSPDTSTNQSSGNGGGDTFIFNSPKSIDEIQAARLLRNTKRDLAEGF